MSTPDEALAAARLAEPAVAEEHVRKAVFKLARLLKSLPEFAATPAGRVRPLLECWYEQNKSCLGGATFDEVRMSFGRAWGRVKRPAGSGDLENAWRAAQTMSPPPPGAEEYGEKMRLLAALCWQLDLIARADGEPFFLSYRMVEEVFGQIGRPVSHTRAGEMLGMLVDDGLLQRLPRDELSWREASEYRYVHGQPRGENGTSPDSG